MKTKHGYDIIKKNSLDDKQRKAVYYVTFSISNRICRIREKMTQKELRQALDVPAQVVSKYKCGLTTPDSVE